MNNNEKYEQLQQTCLCYKNDLDRERKRADELQKQLKQEKIRLILNFEDIIKGAEIPSQAKHDMMGDLELVRDNLFKSYEDYQSTSAGTVRAEKEINKFEEMVNKKEIIVETFEQICNQIHCENLKERHEKHLKKEQNGEHVYLNFWLWCQGYNEGTGTTDSKLFKEYLAKTNTELNFWQKKYIAEKYFNYVYEWNTIESKWIIKRIKQV